MLTPELLDLARALGLALGDTIDTTWFNDPLSRLKGIVSQPAQRAALFDLLDRVAPPVTVAGASATAKWHPLLGARADGNVYLTVDSSGPSVIVGVAANYAGAAASLVIDVPLCSITGSSVAEIAGSSAEPLTLSLAVPVGWTIPAHSVALSAIEISVTLTSTSITLRGLDLDGTGPADALFDPATLGPESTRLLLAFIREQLHALPGPISHLIPLLGLDGSTPQFPFATIASDPRALSSWLRALVTGASPPLTTWLQHLAALLGVAAPTVTATAQRWSVPLFSPNTSSSVDLAITSATASDAVTPLFEIGLSVGLVPSSTPPVRVDIAATLLSIPLAGTAGPSTFTTAGITVSAPADPTQSLIPPGPAFSVENVRAGLAWNGSSIAPSIELQNVVIAGIGSFPVVDLANALTVAGQAASDALSAGVKAALAGTDTGRHLAALAGLVEPATDSSAPLVDLTQLVTHPTRAIAALHRAALLSATHPWKIYFDEIAALLAITTPTTGAGTAADPWVATIADAAPVALQLVAWNAQASTNSADPQQLRLGLRLGATATPISAALSLDLVGADLGVDGTTTLTLVGAFSASVTIVPPTLLPVDGFAVTATSLNAAARVAFGQPPAVSASIAGLSVTTPVTTIAVPTITYPFPSAFDVTNPSAVLGIDVGTLEALIQALLIRALTTALGPTGTGIAAILGAPGIAGLANDSPAATDSATPGSLFTDPLGTLRAWLGKVAVGVADDGGDFMTSLIIWLAATLDGSLAGPVPTPAPLALAGSGSYDDPWQLQFGAYDSRAAVILWLDPDGPPATAATLASDLSAVDNFWTLAVAIRDASLFIPTLPASVDVDALGTGLQQLSDFLAATDGIVPTTSQIPTGGSWTGGTPIGAAHSEQPGDPSACSQTLAAVNAWAAPGSQRAILLLGPAFSDHTTWTALLTQAELANPGTTDASATFNLRVSDVDPASIDLRSVTPVTDFYTADLQDDATNDVAGLVAQIALVVARIQELKPGAALVLVAHSTAGIPARAYTAANPSLVKGLVTLGTPHAGAPIDPLTDAALGDILRTIIHVAPAGVAPGPLADALAHLGAALDSYLAPTAPGGLPRPWPYPIADFIGDGSTDTAGVPALALGGPLGGPSGIDLLGALTTALSTTIGAATRAVPTHLGYGLRVDVPLGTDGAVAVDAAFRLDLGQLPLTSGATPLPRPAQALTALVTMQRPGGWLAGGPLSYAGAGQPLIDTRVRRAELGLSIALGSGKLVGTPITQLHEVAFHGPTTDLVTWGTPLTEAALGIVFQSITTPTPDPTSSLGALLTALRALGLIADDASGGVGIAADAITALTADPLALLAPQLATALSASAIPGFTAIDRQSYQLTLTPLPIEAVIVLDPPSVALRVAANSNVPIASSASIAFSATLPLATMTPSFVGTAVVGPATVTYASGSLTLALPPAIPSLSLYPAPTAAAARSAFSAAIPRLIVDTVASAVLDAALGPGYSVSGVLDFLENPGPRLVSAAALGDGTALDPAKVTALVQSLGVLPSGVTITASGSNPTTIALATGTPLGGVVAIAAGVSVDRTRHFTPAGTITVQAPSSGGNAGPGLTLGVAASGISLALTTGGAASTTIHLLPTFDGAAALAGAAKKLLPTALDGLVTAVSPPPTIVALALDVAAALDLYDAAGGFAAHATQLAAMIDGSWFASVSSTVRTQFITAVTKYFSDPSSPLAGALPGSFASAGSTIVWRYPIPAGIGAGTLALVAGWDAHGPTIALTATGVALAGGPITTSIDAAFANNALAADITLGLDLSSSLGIAVAPQLALALGGSAVALTLLPLGAGTATTLAIPIVPWGAVVASADAALQLLTSWAIPLAADTLLSVTSSDLDTPLWSGGPTAASVLTTAGLITGTSPNFHLVTPLDLAAVPGALLRALGTVSVSLATAPPLSLSFVATPADQLGLRLLGSLPLDSDGSPVFSLLFGRPATWLGTDAGVSLYLFSASGSALAFAPALDVRGLGLGVANTDGSPVLNAGGFRIGAVDAYLAFEVALTPSISVTGIGGGVEIDQLGIPLNALDSGTSTNPVAASLLSGGSQPTTGDDGPANPSVDVTVSYLDGAFAVMLAGQTQPIVIPVHASLGPLYVDQIDLTLDGTTAVEIGVDGDLKIDGLDVDVDELALRIPFASLLTPSAWTLDLQGLSVGFDTDGIAIAGGLRKNPGPPIEYDGMLSVTLPGVGFDIIAAYGRPTDALGAYTSLFIFIAYSQALGGPPFAFVTGLGGGFGYNRQLQIPTDFNQIPSFPLVEAIDGSIGTDDPLSAFVQMAAAIPPRRGAFWIAAGVRFTSFALVNTTAIIAIAIDSGFAIDVLGVSRMALPSESNALASVELALKARYDSQDQTLSVQAQLTDNSYLFSHDCQLTGGFAFFIWFSQSQFVLTMGGYNPAFTVPPQFPTVPRLGFNWAVDSHVVIKGGAYFALTNSCVMAGGSLSVTGSYGAVSAWFDASVDVLVAWDPFSYEFDVGVDIGASATFQVCFIECATVSISLSIGAKLTIAGPPFHGTVTIDAYVTSVTIAFGRAPQSIPYITDWGTFAGKYLTAGDANATAVSLQISSGLLVPSAGTAQTEPGSQASPWQVGIEFVMVTTTRMPANATMVPVSGLNALDIAPMDQLAITSTHIVSFEQLPAGGGTPIPINIANEPGNWTLTPRTGAFPEATWHWTDPAHLPAGARTIAAIAGLTLDAHASFNDPSLLLPVAAWVVDQLSAALPLPFATTAAVVPTLTSYGADADSLAAAVASATLPQTLAASAEVLTGNGVFAAGRAAAGLSSSGLSRLAALSLSSARSAPPLITPITTGLTMRPVGLAAPAPIVTIPQTTAVALSAPRLRAVLGSLPRPVLDAPASVHTTITSTLASRRPSSRHASGRRAAVAVAPPPRLRPPVAPAIAGARLVIVASPTAPRPTTAAVRPRALRNAQLGATIAQVHQAALTQATQDLASTGVIVSAGTTHLWDLPAATGAFLLRAAAARVICLDRGGSVLRDVELLAPPAPATTTGSRSRSTAPGAGQVPIVPGTAMVAITCLGPLPSATKPTPATPAGVTLHYAPPGAAPVIGWQSTSTLAQMGPSTFAARGASLRLVRPATVTRNAQRASYGLTTAAGALEDQLGVETRFPTTITVVIIALDAIDPAASQLDDLAIGIVGAQLSSPTRVLDGARRLLIYDVVSADPKAAALTVAVASLSAWAISAVVAAQGTAASWAATLADGLPDGFVPDGPLAPGGALTVTYAPGARV